MVKKYKDQIDMLWDLKEIVVMIYHQTDENFDVGNLMCTVDETIGELEIW